MIAHLITDRHRLAGETDRDEERRCLLLQARYAVEAGIDCIHIRERDLAARELADLTTAVLALTRGTSTRVVVNDRVDVALACGADGVHLRADSVPVAAVRRMVPGRFLIGRSVHTVQDAVGAAEADYLIAGTVWPSLSKREDHQLLGVQGFRAIVGAASVPVLAIGGVTVDRVEHVVAARGAGVAAISLFMNTAIDNGCRAAPLAETLVAMRRRFDSSGSDS